MRRSAKPHVAQSATSLPRAPKDDAQQRMRRYFLMMSTRVVCFILMVVVTPYSWYTWIFAIGAAVLPYVAVVVANVSAAATTRTAIDPRRAVGPGAPPAPEESVLPVIRLEENREQDDR